ncbi:MAG TPA: four helix bundle protein [Gemmatimonadaceae bacterium]
MQDFTKLRVWQRAHTLTLAIYKQTKSFPASERYGLSAQLREAAVSTAANIAEGCGHRANGSMRHHLQIAVASTCETEAELLVARGLGYLTSDVADELLTHVIEVRRMLIALLKAMEPQPTAKSGRS